MKMFVFLLLMVVLSVNGFCTQEFTTEDSLNGYGWNQYKKINKLIFIQGYETGIGVLGQNVKEKFPGININDIPEYFYPKGKYELMIKYVDKVYENPQNKIIPVYAVLKLYAQEQNELVKNKDKEIIKLLKKYHKDPTYAQWK